MEIQGSLDLGGITYERYTPECGICGKEDSGYSYQLNDIDYYPRFGLCDNCIENHGEEECLNSVREFFSTTGQYIISVYESIAIQVPRSDGSTSPGSIYGHFYKPYRITDDKYKLSLYFYMKFSGMEKSLSVNKLLEIKENEHIKEWAIELVKSNRYLDDNKKEIILLDLQ